MKGVRRVFFTRSSLSHHMALALWVVVAIGGLSGSPVGAETGEPQKEELFFPKRVVSEPARSREDSSGVVTWLSADKRVCRIGERMQIRYGANRDGWVTIYYADPLGEIATLYRGKVEANQEYWIRARAERPTGPHTLTALYRTEEAPEKPTSGGSGGAVPGTFIEVKVEGDGRAVVNIDGPVGAVCKADPGGICHQKGLVLNPKAQVQKALVLEQDPIYGAWELDVVD